MITSVSLSVIIALAALELGSACQGEPELRSNSALLGAGFSNPPQKLELPPGWGVLSLRDRLLPLPLYKTGRVGLLASGERVGTIVIGTAESEVFWTVDLSGTLSNIDGLDTPTEALISRAIEWRSGSKDESEDCIEHQIAATLLVAFSTRESSSAFKLGNDLVIHEGSSSHETWTVIWRDAVGQFTTAAWELEPMQVGILRNIEEGPLVGSDAHPIQEILDCAISQEFEQCRKIALPGLEIVACDQKLDCTWN